ncbi:uncharacterized protein LOC113240196 [Hyposmocoma kahamanoa]|uniref:uncharacterized protein LOC113240196 n=1 Tax=Hyposmocoma kahamanoa TaxID=1477025 RepID=UPI000E6D9544|nr:uncharacterized protein LOC113240196 [Hyposmocoma kahamanoa]
MSSVQDETQSVTLSPSRPRACNLIMPTTYPPPMTSFLSQDLPNMTQVTTNHPFSVTNYTYALAVQPHNASRPMNMNISRKPKKYPKPNPKKLKSKIILSPQYLITNVHHPLMSTSGPAIDTCRPSMNLTHPKPIPPHPLSLSHPPLPLRLPASAPRLSQVDPVAAALSRPKGPPPEYATIDPRKLRTRHLRPIFFRKGAKEKPLSNNSAKNRKLLDTPNCTRPWRLKV